MQPLRARLELVAVIIALQNAPGDVKMGRFQMDGFCQVFWRLLRGVWGLLQVVSLPDTELAQLKPPSSPARAASRCCRQQGRRLHLPWPYREICSKGGGICRAGSLLLRRDPEIFAIKLSRLC